MFWQFAFKKRRKAAHLRFCILIGAWVMAILLLVSSVPLLPTPAIAQATGFMPLQQIPDGAQQVVVGVYPINVYNLDIATNTYYVDAYVWFRWKGEIDPTATVEFVNAVEEWGFSQNVILEEPSQLEDGSAYQVMRIEGRFVQPFNLANFPLDQQGLTILLEDSSHPAEQLVYIADTKDSGYGDTLKVPGWDIMGWKVEGLLHQYDSQFGEIGSHLSSTFAVLRYELSIARPLNFFIWKILLPLVIVLGAHWITFLIDPSMVDIRTAAPATALLTTVFLQQSYSDSLPEVGYLVLLDKIYVLAYLLIIITLTEVIITATWWQREGNAAAARVQRLDRFMLIVQVIVWVVGIALILGMRS